MTEMQTDSPAHQSVVHKFWQQQAVDRPVALLTEVNHANGGSLVAMIGHHYLIWEAWGELNHEMLASSLQAIREACAKAKTVRARLSGFFDLTRVVHMDESVGHSLKTLRHELGKDSPIERAGVVLGSTMARISYDMASLLFPAPWEERVFPTVDEALTWLQDPRNTEVIDVDGLTWIV